MSTNVNELKERAKLFSTFKSVVFSQEDPLQELLITEFPDGTCVRKRDVSIFYDVRAREKANKVVVEHMVSALNAPASAAPSTDSISCGSRYEQTRSELESDIRNVSDASDSMRESYEATERAKRHADMLEQIASLPASASDNVANPKTT